MVALWSIQQQNFFQIEIVLKTLISLYIHVTDVNNEVSLLLLNVINEGLSTGGARTLLALLRLFIFY